MNVSFQDIGGGLLLVSQFTLYGDVRRGLRPSWSDAAAPEWRNRCTTTLLKVVETAGACRDWQLPQNDAGGTGQ